MTEPVPDLLSALASPAESLLADYFDPQGNFAGATFDLFGANDPGRVGPDDLLAVTMLDVSVRPLALRRLLDGEDGGRLAEILSALPVDVDLWDADAGVLAAVDQADDLLRALPGVHGVVASKLLSRKRPRLVPVIDSVVLRQLGRRGDAFKSTRKALAVWLRDEPVRERLEALSSPLPEGVSPLRVLDVVLWLRGSAAGTARRARERADSPG